MHKKQDLKDINIRKDRKGKEGNIAVLLFETEETTQAANGEVNKTEQYTGKKLGQSNRANTPRTESTKEQKQYGKSSSEAMLSMLSKVEDDEIKDCKKRRNILLRYTESRYANTREIKEKMGQYGIVMSIRNRKTEYEKTQKESMVCFATEIKAKRAMTDIKYNYLQER